MKRPTVRRQPALRIQWKRRSQRGFALLLIFLMASAVALMLYQQLPREAFESERDKEQLLIDRGEQYKRAIYLYYISNNRQWPSKIEDLESTNNHRYLRERFADPYTGKTEWRMIHTNGAYLTDSLVTPPPAQGSPGVQGGALAGTGAPTGQTGFSLSSPETATATSGTGTDPNAPPPVNALAQRRASDLTMVQNSSYQTIAGGAPAAPSGNDPGYQPFNPAALPPISLYPNGYNSPPVGAVQPGVNQPGVNQPGLNQPGVSQPGVNPVVNPGQPVNPFGAIQSGLTPNGLGTPNGVNPIGGVSGQPGGINQNNGVNPGATSPVNLPGTNFPMTNQGFVPPNLSSSSFNNQPGAVATQPNSQFGLTPPVQIPSGNAGGPPGVPGFAGAPGAPGAPSQAVNLINQLLTQPRQPPAGIGPNQQTNGGGGLAGVASTYKGVTIKSYADRTKYQEWEFVFQVNQQGSGINVQPSQGPNGSGGIPSGGPATPGAPGAPGGAGTAAPFPGSTSPGIGGSAPASPFGSSSFGSTGFGSSNSPSSPFGAAPTH